jgi:hypothetical protein
MENAKKLRPIGQLFSDTWKFYQLNFKKLSLLMLFGLIGVVPYAASAAIIVSLPTTSLSKTLWGLIMFISFVFLIYWCVSTFLGLLIFIKNPEKKIIDVFNEGRKLFWGSLAISMIVNLFILLWSLLFIVPGVIFWVFYCFAMFAFVYGGYRRSAALKRSKELVSGNWWPVFGRILIASAIILIFGIIFESLASFATHLSIYYYLCIALNYFITFFFFYPLFTIYLTSTYNDLEAIKPESSLPKEKKDYWLVALSSVLVSLAILTFIALLGIMMMYAVRNGLN